MPNMRSILTVKGTDNSLFAIKTKVWDVEKKELLGEFESRQKAAEFLGVKSGTVSKAFKNKHRIHKNKLGKVVCIR